MIQYQFLVIAEMKHYGTEFFNFEHPNKAPNVLKYLLILQTILKSNRLLSIIYPNLSLMINDSFDSLPKFSFNSLPEDIDYISTGKRINAIIAEEIEYENYLFSDKFDGSHNLGFEPVSRIEDWKIVIVLKQPLSRELKTIIKNNTRIWTQFVDTMEQLSKTGYSKCISKKMIDDKTFICLFKLNLGPKRPIEEIMKDTMKFLKAPS